MQQKMPWEEDWSQPQAQPQTAPQSIQIKPAPRPDPVEQQRDQIGLQRDQIALQKAQVDLQTAQQPNANAAKVTEGERTAAFLATRLENAARQMARTLKASPDAAKPSVGAALAGNLGQTARNLANSSERQQIEAAQLDFLDAALTLGTGAAYTKEQLEGYRQSYFPQVGDTDATVAQKSESLRAILQAARVKAGGAAPQIDAALQAIMGGTGAPQSITTADQTPGQAQIVKQEGQTRYSTDTDLEFNALAEATFRNGADRAQMDALAAKYGRAPFGGELDQAIKARGQGGIISFSPTQSGVKDVSAEQAAVGEFFSSPVGAGVAGTANGITLGGIDEGAALIAAAMANGKSYDEALAEINLQKQIVAEQSPVAYGVGNIVGGVGTSMGIGGALAKAGVQGASKVLSVPGILTDAATGAVAGTLEQNTDRGMGFLTGTAAGVAGGMTGRALGKAISPTGGASKPLYEQGVRPTIGQRVGGVANWAEETLGSVPLVGGAVRGARQKARDQFETGAFNQALGEIGVKLPKGIKNGAEAHRFAQNRFSEAYRKAREGLAFTRDQKFNEDYSAFIQETTKDGGLNDQSAKQLGTIIKAQIDRRMKNGALTPDDYKKVNSFLGQRSAAIRNNPSGDGELADALDNLSTILDDAARRNSSPEAVAALDAADRGYAQLVRIETASGMGAIEDAGRFTPKQYAAAVKKDAGGRATRSKAYLRGDALGQEYAEAGLRLADRVPNSGTAERAAALAAIGGAGYVAPASLAIPAAAAALYAPGVRTGVNALMAPRTGASGRLLNPLGNSLATPTRMSLAGPNALLWAKD